MKRLDRRTINRVEVLETGELFLGLEGEGDPAYQYVYREAAGVYWDPNKNGFKSTPMKDWSCHDWFRQIVKVVRTGLGLELVLGQEIIWVGVPDDQKAKITSDG